MSMESTTCKKRSSVSAIMLGPGFRFHPTDEELVWYYLRRKIVGKALRFDAISEIDIYKAEPWDLPCNGWAGFAYSSVKAMRRKIKSSYLLISIASEDDMSKLKTRDLEWYFFSVLDKKYGNGARTNRATEKGYWKTTGKDRAVYHSTQTVGMKKTLVYHSGRAPKGQRSNWVMHEYRLVDLHLGRAGIAKDAFVLCRVFQKSGSGPKNGEQYGAPFVEEDWDNDELEMTPEDEAVEEVGFGLDSHDLQQILESDIPLNAASVPQFANISNVEETKESFDSNQNLLARAGYQYCEPKQYDGKNMHSLPGNSGVVDFLLDEPFLDSFDNLQDGDGGLVKANEFSNPTENDTTAIDMLEEYLAFFDATDDTSLYFDPAMMLGSEDLVSDQAYFPQREMVEGIESAILPSGQHVDYNNKVAALSSDKQENAKYHTDFQHTFVERASQMLGGIPAPPALAAEFPPEDALRRLNSVLPSSDSLHVNAAGMIQIRNSNMVSHGSRKHENFNIVLCFGFSRGDDGLSSLESSLSISPGKTVATVSRCWLCLVFIFLILSISVKIGTSYMHVS
ncbi:hypothetical protein OROMI_010442 [Orobanche minor]